MAFQDSQRAIEKLYDVLDFKPGENLATTQIQPDNVYEKTLFDSANKKLGAESIFFYRPPNGGTSIPYIYFCRLEGLNPVQAAQDIAKLHQLAWNMGRAPLLFAVLPTGQILIYDTYFPPTDPQPNQDYQTGLIDSLNVFSETEKERRKFLIYHRREFESGHFWQEHGGRFDPKQRADYTLLENLKVMRRELVKLLSEDIPSNLASEITHSLLGRAIFIKYLEDRRDYSGNNVFPDHFFEEYKQGATCFLDVLSDKEATYRLFKYLNDKFNGDIFPVEEAEKKYITNKHLDWLKLFLTGEIQLSTGQFSLLWKFYSFDVIPIEFISNIYEEFFHIQQDEKRNKNETKPQNNGTYYTPHHLVEFLIDEVLPWEGTETDFRTLDPACGSGIFLVEIYRRLIARWYQANPGKDITDIQLKELLINNIFGVDLDSEAIRVAAFSLYLTLCDFLEPRQIWEKVKFPQLRYKNLFPADFFDKNQWFTEERYNLIIGNPPWQSELTPAAQQYCKDVEITSPDRQVAPDNQIALAFLWRAVEFCKPFGEICLLMPSKGLLFNRSGTHQVFRRDFFSTFHVKTIINLSVSRHILFEKAVGPGSAIFYTPQQPDQTTPILYCVPKPTHSVEDQWQVTIEPQDIAQLPRTEAAESDIIWKVAMWGGPRDYELVKRLMSSSYQSLREICSERGWVEGEGFIEGNKKEDASFLLGKPYVDARNLARFALLEERLPLFSKPKLERPRTNSRAIFDGPHILLKQSPKTGENSFRAALVQSGAVFSQSLVGINAPPDDINLLAYYCLILNSRIPLYFALMSSGRWLVERDELTKEESISFPLPKNFDDTFVSYETLKQLSIDTDNQEDQVKNLVEKFYNLTEDEQILIDDAINYTLNYFRLKTKSKATASTFNKTDGEFFLEQYLQVVKRTLENSFGKQFRSIIFQGNAPLRVVALSLAEDSDTPITQIIVEKSQQALEQALSEVNKLLIEQRSNIFIRRNVRGYIGKTIYIIKPDQRRYWTRANALRDADEIYADIMEAWRPQL